LNKLWSDFIKEGKNYNDILAWAHSKVIKEALTIFKTEYKTDNKTNKKIRIVIDKFDEYKMDYRLKNLDHDKIEVIQKIAGESEIPVAAASIVAKKIFEDYLKKFESEFNITNIKNIDPKSLDAKIIPRIAKIHFKNISNILEKSKG
jgi:ribonuclease HIII